MSYSRCLGDAVTSPTEVDSSLLNPLSWENLSFPSTIEPSTSTVTSSPVVEGTVTGTGVSTGILLLGGAALAVYFLTRKPKKG